MILRCLIFWEIVDSSLYYNDIARNILKIVLIDNISSISTNDKQSLLNLVLCNWYFFYIKWKAAIEENNSPYLSIKRREY